MGDVAKLAGVSTATVSRVIHGTVRVKPSRRSRVEQAIQTLGYVPHLGAQELASGKTKVVGVVVGTISNPATAAIVDGIEARLQESGYRFLLSNSHYEEELEQKLIRTYVSINTAGVISVGSWCKEDFWNALPSKDTPIVLVSPDTSAGSLPTVSVDGVLGGRLAGQHLIHMGHRRIAYIGPRPVGEVQRARQEGLRQALLEAGVSLDSGLVLSAGAGAEAGYLGVQRLLSQGRFPTAIFCFHDLSAYGAMEALKEAGKRVPEDVSVVGFDDIFMSRYLGLTTLAQPLVEIGRLAAQIILEHLMNQMHIANIRVAPELVARGSTAVCSVDHP